MCKIMIMTGLKPKNVGVAWQFIEEMASKITKGNTDGLGYAALTSDGKLFGERWLHNNDAFDYRPTKDKLDSIDSLIEQQEQLVNDYSDILKVEKIIKKRADKDQTYDSFGDTPITQDTMNNMSSIIMHARYATSGKGFINTHPFYDKETNTALIHNGVIDNPDAYGSRVSNCDSEALLKGYVDHKLMSEPAQINNMLNKLRGYFACGVISRNETDGWFVDVFKNTANLEAVYIKELECVVITTRVDDALDVCKSIGLTPLTTFEFIKERFLRLNPFTGAILERYSFDHQPPSLYESSHGSMYKNYSGYGRHSKQQSFNDPGETKHLPSENVKENIRRLVDKVGESDALIEARKAKEDGWEKLESGTWIKRSVY